MAIAELPIASQPIADSLAGAAPGPPPPGATLLAGQIAPARRPPEYLPALAPFIPGPLTDVIRAPNFTRYYDWHRINGVLAQDRVWQVMPWAIPGALTDITRTPHFSKPRRWPSTAPQTWVFNANRAAFTPPWFQVFTG